MNIVICNAVGVDREGNYIVHSPSRWSFSMKNYDDVFTYYPWELCYTSSLLKQRTSHRVKFFDPCLEKWDGEQTIRHLLSENPDLILMEPSSRTFREDMAVAREVKARSGAKIALAGQHASAFPEELSKEADYILTGEYEETMLDVVSGKDRKHIPGLFPNARRPSIDVSKLPWPEDTNVSRLRYAIPGEPNCEHTEIQMYASRGCPFHCNYCASGTIYFAGWRPRHVKDVADEIEAMGRKYPECDGFFLDEEEHNTGKKFIMELTEEIRRRGLNTYKFDAMCAYFNLDRQVLEAMATAGYYKIRAGIETASEKTARGMDLGGKFNLEKLYNAMTVCKELGLHFYGTFTIGGWGSTREDDLKTGRLIEDVAAKGLMHDLQMSINTPQPGTPFYKKAKEAGYLLTEDWHKFDGGRQSVVNYPDYPAEEIVRTYDDVLRHYDRGLYRRNRELFQRRFSETFSRNGRREARRVLLLRSTRMWHIRLAVESLRAAGSEVTLLGQNRIQPDLADLGGLDAFYSYGDGHMHPESIERDLLSTLREKNYDLVLVPYNNMTGRSYENVRKVAHRIAADRVAAVAYDGSLLPVQ